VKFQGDFRTQYKAKSVTPVDEYVWTLGDDLKEIAERDFRETEELRNFALKAIRDWMLNNPRIIKSRFDSTWILKHLRYKKFSIPMTQDTLERHQVLRDGSHGKSSFHDELDIMRKGVKRLFDYQ